MYMCVNKGIFWILLDFFRFDTNYNSRTEEWYYTQVVS